jgi:hypothetical protein
VSSPAVAVAAAAAVGIAGGQLEELGLKPGRGDVGWQQLDGLQANRRPMFRVLVANHMLTEGGGVQAGRSPVAGFAAVPVAVPEAGLHLGTENEDRGSETRVGMASTVPRRSTHWAATVGLVYLIPQ